MVKEQLVAVTIHQYGTLQQIKQANGGQENQALAYALKLTVAKLSPMGVNAEDITLS